MCPFPLGTEVHAGHDLPVDIEKEFRAVIGSLNAAAIPYAVCGGFAVIIHGFPRFTEDIDILIREEDLDRIKENVRPLGFSINSGSFVFKPGQPGESRFVRLVKVEGEDFVMLDLLAVTPPLEAAFADRKTFPVGALEVSVISREGLRQMKRTAGRAKDLEDLRKLRLDQN